MQRAERRKHRNLRPSQAYPVERKATVSWQLGNRIFRRSHYRLPVAEDGECERASLRRHHTLVHLLIVTASFLTYLLDRDDVVWMLVRGRPDQDLLERALFAVAAALMGIGALLRTWAGALPETPQSPHLLRVRGDGPYRYVPYPRQIGNLVYSIGLGFLAPMEGFLLLVLGQALVALRLIRRERELGNAAFSSDRAGARGHREMSDKGPSREARARWATAFRHESAKWGLFLTMIVFTVLLRDRVAEILAGVSFLMWVALNCGSLTGGVAHS